VSLEVTPDEAAMTVPTALFVHVRDGYENINGIASR